MRARNLLPLALVGVATVVAHAADPGLTVRFEARRRYVAVVAQGNVPGGAGAATARIRRGDATALEQPVTLGADGSLRCELRTEGRLLPDGYVFEVARGATVLAQQPFRVGTPDEVEPARERLRHWLLGARRTVRGFSSLLERQAAYHQAQILSIDSRTVVEVQLRAWENVKVDFDAKFRAARMDFALYEREVVLSPFAKAGEAIGKLFKAVDDRRAKLAAAFESALSRRKDPIAPSPEILALAKVAAAELGLAEDDSPFWSAGPLGEPEVLAVKDGRLTSALGFSLLVPAGWTQLDLRATDGDDPHVRLLLDGPAGMKATVRVLEMPEARSWDDVKKFVNVLSWEEWGGRAYKLLESGDVAGRASFRILAQVLGRAGDPKRLLQIEAAPASGRRLYELRILVPEDQWNQHRVEAERLAEEFRLVEKP